MFITDATHLHQIMNCNGSRLLPNAPRPKEDDTTLREEGNAAHWLAQECFEGRIDINDVRDDIKANNGVAVTVFMFQHVREYLLNLQIGAMETVTTWGLPGFEIRGRADHIGYDESVDTLDIDDFKYGYSPVEPEWNWTLISHAISRCLTAGRWPARIRLRIHQPRPYHPSGPLREWIITGQQLADMYQQIVNTMTNPDDLLRTGPHCGKCSKLGVCPAARQASMNAVDLLLHAYTDDLDDAELADELRLVEYGMKTLKKRLEAIQDVAKHRVETGRVLPGFQLERTYKNTNWRPNLTPDMLKALTGRDLAKPKLVSPSEAKAYGVPDLMMNALTTRVESGVKLVQVDVDKRVRDMMK